MGYIKDRIPPDSGFLIVEPSYYSGLWSKGAVVGCSLNDRVKPGGLGIRGFQGHLNHDRYSALTGSCSVPCSNVASGLYGSLGPCTAGTRRAPKTAPARRLVKNGGFIYETLLTPVYGSLEAPTAVAPLSLAC